MPTVLLTGVTGFLGGATAAALLSHHSCPLIVLVRGDNPNLASLRTRQSLLRFLDPATLQKHWSRCEVLHGDLTDPAILADPRLAQVTHVLHLAANTSFRSIRSVRSTNILGTLALAHRMRRVGSLLRFLYVGTAYICGACPPRRVHEEDYPRLSVEHLVEYTASKAECEMLLQVTAPELPLVIARPSVVVGHTTLGCSPSASLFWYYRALARLGYSPTPPETRKDIVPVDYVASALLHLIFKSNLQHRCYHVSAGETSSKPWQEIANAFTACWGEPTRPITVLDAASMTHLQGRMNERLGPGNQEQLLQALRLYFRFSTSGVEVFDNQRLLDEGMPEPPRFTEYLPLCLTTDTRSVYDQMLDDA